MNIMIEKRIYIRLIEGISLFCSKFKAQAAGGYIDIKDKGQYWASSIFDGLHTSGKMRIVWTATGCSCGPASYILHTRDEL